MVLIARKIKSSKASQVSSTSNFYKHCMSLNIHSLLVLCFISAKMLHIHRSTQLLQVFAIFEAESGGPLSNNNHRTERKIESDESLWKFRKLMVDA